MRKVKNLVILAALASTSFPVHANVIQYFFGYNYRNPVDANSVKRYELFGGASIVNVSETFFGTAGGGGGWASTNETSGLPFFYGALRLSDKWAFGLNVSTPYYSNFQYPLDSIVRYDVTKFITRDEEINPFLSYKVSDKLTVGAGFIANDMYHEELDFVIPDLGNLTTKSQSWSYGWDVGFSYAFNDKNTFKLAYFSQLINDLRGTSRVDGLVNNNFKFDGLNLPATTKAEYVLGINQDLTLDFKLYYSEWSLIDVAHLENIATGATIPIPVHYHNTWAAQAAGLYQFNPKWGFLAAAIFDQGAPNLKGRTVAFPSTNSEAIVFGTNYKIIPEATVSVAYAYVFNDTRVSHPLNVSEADGSMSFRSNIVEISLDYKV